MAYRVSIGEIEISCDSAEEALALAIPSANGVNTPRTATKRKYKQRATKKKRGTQSAALATAKKKRAAKKSAKNAPRKSKPGSITWPMVKREAKKRKWKGSEPELRSIMVKERDKAKK